MAVNASVKVDAADPWGILISNGEFTSFVDPNFGVSYGPSIQIVVSGTLPSLTSPPKIFVESGSLFGLILTRES